MASSSDRNSATRIREARSDTQRRELIKFLVRFAKRLSGQVDPEDVAQNTFLRATRVEDAPSPRAYLARTARNLVIDEVRKLRVRGSPALALDDLDDAHAPWVAADQETTLLLKQVILGLPPLYRDVFILNRFVGLTHAEIAQRYGITVKAVEYRMSRALALCGEALRA